MGGGSFFWFAETDFIEKFAKKVAQQITKENEEDE